MRSESWGPDARRAVIVVSFHGLAGLEPGEPVTPGLPTALRVLAERRLRASWFVEPALAESEPFALQMIVAGGHELGCLAPGDELTQAREALGGFGNKPVRGMRPPPGAAEPEPEQLREVGLAYSSPAGSEDPVPDRLPFDPALSEDDHLAPEGGGAHALHQALQAGIGATLTRGGYLCLALRPRLFERRDTIDIAIETFDLIAGLVRAERLWTPTLAELSDWLADEASEGAGD